MPRQRLWDFPFLTLLLGRRPPTAPQSSPDVTAPGEVITATSVVTTTPEGDVVAATVQAPVLVGTYKTAAGVSMDVYENPNTGRYDVKCPSSPYYNKTGEFRTVEDAKWYIEEVAMGSSSEAAAAAAQTPLPVTERPQSTSPYGRI